MKQVRVNWEQIYRWVDILPDGIVYGVPRGGAVLAGIASARRAHIIPTQDVHIADYVIDDIVDSGATKVRYEKMGKVFYAMNNKEDWNDDDWIVYPWEGHDPLKDNEDTVRRQLELIGEDPSREGLRETPKRYLKAMQEMTSGYNMKAEDVLSTTFDANGYDEIVVLRDIAFTSLCEHHLLPFNGTASVAYIPNERVVGLSKLARLVDMHAQRLQIQEKMTSDIRGDIDRVLQPKGVAVLINAHHSCMGCRGIKKAGATMGTSALSGLFREDPKARAEVMELLR